MFVKLLIKILWLYCIWVSQVSKIVVVNLNEYFKLITTNSKGPHSESRSIFDHEVSKIVIVDLNEYFKLITTDSKGHSESRSIFDQGCRTNIIMNDVSNI